MFYLHWVLIVLSYILLLQEPLKDQFYVNSYLQSVNYLCTALTVENKKWPARKTQTKEIQRSWYKSLTNILKRPILLSFISLSQVYSSVYVDK